ncbi:hypothetical protein SAMN04489834_2273 [Microterricola viridarii]|uniref:Uncharacterized protein n=1 Tax=Microterricola viridarii TaxID=412690 RepID=A0A1H1VK18_9MICO|nr:hypothetical protein SAMN04489834_2273 [Microterricola viridarii]
MTFLVGFGLQPASAGDASSDTGTFTVSGKTYTNYATVTGNTSGHWASARTTTSRPGAQNGDMGSKGRLFTSNNSLSCEGNITYNSGASYANGDSCTRWQTGSWYSYGVSYGWNGSGYNPVYTFQSRLQNS